MITKTIEVNKRMTFREIFKKINENTEDMLIRNVNIGDNLINYDLQSEENEVSITLILKDDGIFPLVIKIVVSMENGDLNVINNLKRVWVDEI